MATREKDAVNLADSLRGVYNDGGTRSEQDAIDDMKGRPVDPSLSLRGTVSAMKVTSKNQMVLPSAVRKRSGIEAGDTLYAYALKDGDVLLSRKSPLERARRDFAGKKLWGDPLEDRENESAAWDTRLEKTYDSLS